MKNGEIRKLKMCNVLIRPSVKENMCFCLYATLHFQYNSSVLLAAESIRDSLDIKMQKRVSSNSKVFNILSKGDDKECNSLTQQRHMCKTNLPDNVLHQIRLVHNVSLFSLKTVKNSIESSIKQDLK